MLSANRHTAPTTARVILFMGAPGSGKGTQSGRLSSELGIPCLSTGEILRSEAKRNTVAGSRLRQLLASGSLASDETVCALVGSRLRRQTSAILDGFPRTINQASYLDHLLGDLRLPRPIVLHLHVSKQGLLRRLTGRRQCAVCGAIYNLHSRPSLRGSRCENDGGALVERDDDTEGVVLRRFAEFENVAAPLIDYYRGPEYHLIDGDRDPDVVAQELLTIVQRQEVLIPA